METAPAGESQKYNEMLEKVENIVETISHPDLDLDDMVTKVEEGYQLIQAMKLRLEQTKTRIDQLRQDFEENAD